MAACIVEASKFSFYDKLKRLKLQSSNTFKPRATGLVRPVKTGNVVFNMVVYSRRCY